MCINVLMCIEKKSNHIHRDCLPTITLLYVMLYIMLAYLMLFTALFNALYLYNAYSFLAIDFCSYFSFSCFVLGVLTHRLLFEMLFCIIHSTFKQLDFLILC